MSKATDALKKAIEFEKLALDHYKDAIEDTAHQETRQYLEKIAADKNQQIDSLHWMLMAESGNLELGEAQAQEGSQPVKTGSGKCPFSGMLSEMGFDMDSMRSDMKDGNPH